MASARRPASPLGPEDGGHGRFGPCWFPLEEFCRAWKGKARHASCIALTGHTHARSDGPAGPRGTFFRSDGARRSFLRVENYKR